MRKGQLTPASEWWKHLRWAKRVIGPAEGVGGLDLGRDEVEYLRAAVEEHEQDSQAGQDPAGPERGAGSTNARSGGGEVEVAVGGDRGHG